MNFAIQTCNIRKRDINPAPVFRSCDWGEAYPTGPFLIYGSKKGEAWRGEHGAVRAILHTLRQPTCSSAFTGTSQMFIQFQGISRITAQCLFARSEERGEEKKSTD